ncbi:MAG: hypothetical protein IJC80_00805 [Clostridia bacterium]|nr:hypothetical protein [Clostridia bacterium]
MDNERFTPFVLIIERITKNIKRIADMEMEPYGLRSSHVMCILQLAKSENGLSSSALAEACGVDKAFISRITSELLEKNYIVKEIVPGKTYKTSFLLTEAGEEINRKMNEIIANRIASVDKHVTMKELQRFYAVLNEIDEGISLLADK